MQEGNNFLSLVIALEERFWFAMVWLFDNRLNPILLAFREGRKSPIAKCLIYNSIAQIEVQDIFYLWIRAVTVLLPCAGLSAFVGVTAQGFDCVIHDR